MNAVITQCFAQDREIQSSDGWEAVTSRYPGLPRGWFELAHLAHDQRVDFVEQFWMHQLREEPHLVAVAEEFFPRLDTIRVFLRKQEPYLVYSLRTGGFFAGQLPLGESVIEAHSFLGDCPLPRSYLTFQALHGRFHQGEDVGILAAIDIEAASHTLHKQLRGRLLEGPSHEAIDVRKLIPFYQSFGGNYWHCFTMEWFPGEMGCVTIQANKKSTEPRFAGFASWLATYLLKELP